MWFEKQVGVEVNHNNTLPQPCPKETPVHTHLSEHPVKLMMAVPFWEAVQLVLANETDHDPGRPAPPSFEAISFWGSAAAWAWPEEAWEQQPKLVAPLEKLDVLDSREEPKENDCLEGISRVQAGACGQEIHHPPTHDNGW